MSTSHTIIAGATRPLPPCGGELERGVKRAPLSGTPALGDTLLTPLPAPPPQGGRETSVSEVRA